MAPIKKSDEIEETIKGMQEIDALIVEQRRLDKQTNLMAQEIVDERKLKTLEEAKQFAAGWIEVAAMHARNEEYWAKRARAAEAQIVSMTRPE